MSGELYHTPDFGKVYLVGAGPGDPELITVKGSKVLKEADVIVYDRLANPELLSLTSKHSEHIYVGKRPGKPSVSQDQINRIMIARVREGKTVVRLKGGDPFVFGRGGEECESLKAEGIPYAVVPGISSALAAPAFAGIPVTYRKVARSLTVVTGHTVKNSHKFDNWGHLAHADTLVILMGMRNLPKITDTLIGYGRASDTPAAVIEKATYCDQKSVVATLGTIADRTIHLSPPAVIVVGELASMGNDLGWFQLDEPGNEREEQNHLLQNFAG